MSIIEFRGVNKLFGDFQVLEDIDLFENPENERTKRSLNQILY
jgi:hypothetical protein